MDRAAGQTSTADTASWIITLVVFLLAFVPVGYLTIASFCAAAPWVQYGVSRTWNESITALPRGKGSIAFSTGDVVTHTSSVRMAVLSVGLMCLFVLLASGLVIPALHVVRLGLSYVAPEIARKIPSFEKQKSGVHKGGNESEGKPQSQVWNARQPHDNDGAV